MSNATYDQKLIKDINALMPNYMPEHIQAREDNIEELSRYFFSYKLGSVPSNIMILGPPGSGKSLCIKHVLKQIHDLYNVSIYYTTSRSSRAFFLDIAQQCGLHLTRKNLHLRELFTLCMDELERQGKNVLIVLDEVDKLLEAINRIGDPEFDLLFYLSRPYEFGYTIGLSLILISNNQNLTQMIADERTMSSLQLKLMPFQAYQAQQIASILFYRRQLAFYKGACEDDALSECAQLTCRVKLDDSEDTIPKLTGDARLAIDLLRITAENCAFEGVDRVTASHIRRAFRSAKVEAFRRSIIAYDLHKVLLLNIIADKSGRKAGTFYDEYSARAGKYELEPRSLRKLQTYIDDFKAAGWVQEGRTSKGYKQGVEWRYYVHEGIDASIVLETTRQLLDVHTQRINVQREEDIDKLITTRYMHAKPDTQPIQSRFE